MIALVEARRAGLFAANQWLPNIIAGVIVGVVALPLAMAFAIASGARPEQGLYTAIIGGACVSIFGGSRVQIAGPTGAFVAILSGHDGGNAVTGDLAPAGCGNPGQRIWRHSAQVAAIRAPRSIPLSHHYPHRPGLHHRAAGSDRVAPVGRGCGWHGREPP
jgi:hypothetical protein